MQVHNCMRSYRYVRFWLCDPLGYISIVLLANGFLSHALSPKEYQEGIALNVLAQLEYNRF